jgi:uncharacterized repeat protein (TIGR03803 family)
MKPLAFSLAVLLSLGASRAESQTFTTLVQFTGSGGTTIGQNPIGSLMVSGTTLFGMTSGGNYSFIGLNNVFSVGTNGANYQSLVTFTGTGGAACGEQPYGSLTLVGTSLYGMTNLGGTMGYGNVFSVGTNGTGYQNLVSFSGSGGANIGSCPVGSLTISGTTLYGMTSGLVPPPIGQGPGFVSQTPGNVFSVGTNGTNYQNLLSFTGTGGAAIGRLPQELGSLTLTGTTLYGTTSGGGANNDGVVFSVGVNGSNYRSLVSFTGSGNSGAANGMYSPASLTLSGTTFYGVTFYGGVHGDGNVFSVGVDGTDYHNLLSFTGSGSAGAANGQAPRGSLTISGSRLYGMTAYGGTYGDGNLFSLGADGSGYQDLHDFTGGADGASPFGGLTLSGGTLFGMTYLSGDLSVTNGRQIGGGTIFAYTLPTPEPGTMTLVGCGAAALVSYRWRRMRRRQRR